MQVCAHVTAALYAYQNNVTHRSMHETMHVRIYIIFLTVSRVHVQPKALNHEQQNSNNVLRANKLV